MLTTPEDAGASGSRLGRSDPRLISRPLDFIHAEHLRHRELCRIAEELADATDLDHPLARGVIAFLERDLPLHVIDEEEDLFPILRRRLKPTDEAERVIGLLSGEHAADEALAGEIAAGLAVALEAAKGPLPKVLRNALLTFADRQRRHLTVENAIVLPLAGRRLTKRDLAEVARRMAARRGLTLSQVVQ
jgi:hemerythrin-like domain-containing protein